MESWAHLRDAKHNQHLVLAHLRLYLNHKCNTTHMGKQFKLFETKLNNRKKKLFFFFFF